MTVTLVADCGAAVGLGHLRRVEAIGAALADRGVPTTLRPLESAPVETVTGVAVVVDSYRFRADDPDRVRADVVVAVDELGRNLAVDLVVDPTPGAAPTRDAAARAVLAGANYALVHPQWATAPDPPPPGPTRILVTFGATAAAAAALDLAHALVADHPECRVTAAVGPWCDGVAAVGVELVTSAAGLAAEIRAATVVVCAGGVTMLEACAGGRAVVAVPVADNQQAAVAALADRGAVVAPARDAVQPAVAALLRDPDARTALAARARTIIDGGGAARVAAAIVELRA